MAKGFRVQLTPEVARRRKLLRSTFLHPSKSHSAAIGMHEYSAHELRAKKRGYVCFAAVNFAFFFRGGQVNPIQTS